MLDWFSGVASAGPWTYPAVALFVAVDGFFPVLPGETVAITASVAAGHGDLTVWLVVLAAFVGAVAGDNVSYLLGVKLGRAAARRLFKGDRSKRILAWAERQLRERGRVVILAARFVPGGRTATTFAAGTLEMPWGRFMQADLVAAAAWSGYVTAIGYFGGEAFQNSWWKALLLSFGLAAAAAIAGELTRRLTGGDDHPRRSATGEGAQNRRARSSS